MRLHLSSLPDGSSCRIFWSEAMMGISTFSALITPQRSILDSHGMVSFYKWYFIANINKSRKDLGQNMSNLLAIPTFKALKHASGLWSQKDRDNQRHYFFSMLNMKIIWSSWPICTKSESFQRWQVSGRRSYVFLNFENHKNCLLEPQHSTISCVRQIQIRLCCQRQELQLTWHKTLLFDISLSPTYLKGEDLLGKMTWCRAILSSKDWRQNSVFLMGQSNWPILSNTDKRHKAYAHYLK